MSGVSDNDLLVLLCFRRGVQTAHRIPGLQDESGTKDKDGVGQLRPRDVRRVALALHTPRPAGCVARRASPQVPQDVDVRKHAEMQAHEPGGASRRVAWHAERVRHGGFLLLDHGLLLLRLGRVEAIVVLQQLGSGKRPSRRPSDGPLAMRTVTYSNDL